LSPAENEPADAEKSAQADKPRIAVVFEEKVQGVFGLSGSWMDPGRGEEALITRLRNNNYNVIDSQTARANILREQAVQVLAGDQKAAIAVGSKLQAPYVIVGKGFAKSAGNVSGSSMKSMQAQVQLTAINAQNGEIIGSATARAAIPHVDETSGGAEALAAASEEASDELMGQLGKLPVVPAAAGGLKVAITGLRSYRHYLVLKEWIEKNTPGFQKIESENYTAGSADFALACSAKGHDFAEKIAVAKFQGFAVNPLDVSDASVTLKVIVDGQ
jgi:hypothetical protein